MQMILFFYYRHSNVNSAIEVMQHDLDKYYQWYKYNTLTLNINKTKTMVFDSRNRDTE